jgi:hypothetical protein
MIMTTGLPSWRRSKPDVVKIPAPIMSATTMFVEAKRPSRRSRPGPGVLMRSDR